MYYRQERISKGEKNNLLGLRFREVKPALYGQNQCKAMTAMLLEFPWQKYRIMWQEYFHVLLSRNSLVSQTSW